MPEEPSEAGPSAAGPSAAGPSAERARDDGAADTLYGEALYYRLLFRERRHDLGLYLRVTEGAPEVLELGVGEGRLAVPLAEAGRRVVGVDRAPAMLEAARARLREASAEARGRVELHRADVRTLALGRRFERVICPFNGFAHHLDDEDLATALERVRAHLSPGGRFAFDVMIPSAGLLDGGASSVPRFEHPRTGAVCRMEERYEYDAARCVLTIRTILTERETGDEQTLCLRLRQFATDDMAALLSRHGFEVLQQTAELGDSVAWVCAASG